MVHPERVDARKERIGADDAMKLAADCNEIIVAKGKKLTRFRMKDDPDRGELVKAMLGPTGNLRAPTLRVGKKLLIGFSPAAYDEVFR